MSSEHTAEAPAADDPFDGHETLLQMLEARDEPLPVLLGVVTPDESV